MVEAVSENSLYSWIFSLLTTWVTTCPYTRQQPPMWLTTELVRQNKLLVSPGWRLHHISFAKARWIGIVTNKAGIKNSSAKTCSTIITRLIIFLFLLTYLSEHSCTSSESIKIILIWKEFVNQIEEEQNDRYKQCSNFPPSTHVSSPFTILTAACCSSR